MWSRRDLLYECVFRRRVFVCFSLFFPSTSSGLGKTGKSWTWKRTGTAKWAHQTRETRTTCTQIWSQGSYERNLAEWKSTSGFSGAFQKLSVWLKWFQVLKGHSSCKEDGFSSVPLILLNLCIFICIACLCKCIFRVYVTDLSLMHLTHQSWNLSVCSQEKLIEINTHSWDFFTWMFRSV